MEVKCSLKRFKPWGEAVKTFEKIEMANKLDELEEYLEELYGDSIDGSELNDILAGYIDIGLNNRLGLEKEESSEEVQETYIGSLNKSLEEALEGLEENIDSEDELIGDEYEDVRNVLDAYANSENAFVDGFVTFEDLKQFDADHWLPDWSDQVITDVALEMGYEVKDNKIFQSNL